MAVVLFIVYLLALVWIILFKLRFSISELHQVRAINLIPLQGSFIKNGRIDFGEIIDNALIFIPFGIYLCRLCSRWSFVQKALLMFGASLTLETLQFALAIGRTDITDLIANTLGGIVGIGIYAVIRKIFKDRTAKIIDIVALVATICMILLIAMLFIANR